MDWLMRHRLQKSSATVPDFHLQFRKKSVQRYIGMQWNNILDKHEMKNEIHTLWQFGAAVGGALGD